LSFLLKGDANVQIASISEELAKKTEDAARQQEEITHLLSQIVDLQKKAKAVRLLFLSLTEKQRHAVIGVVLPSSVC
jgi:arginine deiminase